MLELITTGVLAAVLILALGLQYLERQEWARERQALLTAAATERTAWTAERAELLNRIQHPRMLPGETQAPTKGRTWTDAEAARVVRGDGQNGK